MKVMCFDGRSKPFFAEAFFFDIGDTSFFVKDLSPQEKKKLQEIFVNTLG